MTARKSADEPAAPEVAPDAPAFTGPASWIRVRDTETGHEFDVSPHLADTTSTYRRLNASRAYPDLYGNDVHPRPTKYRTDKAGQSATDNTES